MLRRGKSLDIQSGQQRQRSVVGNLRSAQWRLAVGVLLADQFCPLVPEMCIGGQSLKPADRINSISNVNC